METKINNAKQFIINLKQGKYIWPGGYPTFFLTYCNGAMCHSCANEEKINILKDTKRNINSGWNIVGIDVNWEGPLYCDHCGELIESAYGDEIK